MLFLLVRLFSMLKCAYHPEAKGTATCPQCRQPICDRCRLNGTSLRCGHCQSQHNRGGGDATARAKRVCCANHPDIPTETRCSGCKKPHCVACLNGSGHCFKCALSVSRGGSGRLHDPYGEAAPRATASAQSKQGASKAGLAVLGALILAGVGAFVFLRQPAPPSGPARVAILAPAANATLSGGQAIRVSVATAEAVDRVELTLDGKYWDRLQEPPYESHWPTSLTPNGSHVIEARAHYRDGRVAKSSRRVTTWNRGF